MATLDAAAAHSNDVAATTAPVNKQRGNGNLKPPFKAGESGNLLGRPHGARAKFAEQSMKDLLHDWEQHGAANIRQVREEYPDVYFRVAFSTLPKDVRVELETRSTGPFDGVERQKVRRLLDMVDTVAAATHNDFDQILEWVEEDLRVRMARQVTTIEGIAREQEGVSE